jgi:hypothetical protein
MNSSNLHEMTDLREANTGFLSSEAFKIHRDSKFLLTVGTYVPKVAESHPRRMIGVKHIADNAKGQSH